MVRAALYSTNILGFTIVQIYDFFFCEKETAAWTIFFVGNWHYFVRFSFTGFCRVSKTSAIFIYPF